MTHQITITGPAGDQVLKCNDCSWAKHFDGWTITTIDKGDVMVMHTGGVLGIRADLVLQEPMPDVFAEFLGGIK